MNYKRVLILPPYHSTDFRLCPCCPENDRYLLDRTSIVEAVNHMLEKHCWDLISADAVMGQYPPYRKEVHFVLAEPID